MDWAAAWTVCIGIGLLASVTFTKETSFHIRNVTDMFMGAPRGEDLRTSALSGGGTQLTNPGKTYMVRGTVSRGETVFQDLRQSSTSGAGSHNVMKQTTEFSPGVAQGYDTFVITPYDDYTFTDKNLPPEYIPSQVNSQEGFIEPPTR